MTDHPKIELQDALCVSSPRFEYLGEDTLVSQAGAALLFLSLSSHKQSALQFPAGYSLDAWALSNPTPLPSGHGAAQVVVALSGVDTRIHVYSWPRLHLEQCLMCETDVCYTRLALSRDGRHLAGVSAESASTLRYWDLQAPELDLQIGDDHADHPTNVMLREREVRMPLHEPASFLAFNPFNHTQLVVGNERSVTVVTVTAATSFQIATLTPQPVAIDFNNLNNRKVLGALWLSERVLLLHTQTGEILAVNMRTPTSILAMRERELAAQQQAAAAAGGGGANGGGAETPGLDRSVSNATPAGGLLPSSNAAPAAGGAGGGEIEVGLTHLTNADLALLGLVDSKAPPQARIDWKGEESKGWAASSALAVTTWTAHLPPAPADAEEDEEADHEAEAGVARRSASSAAPSHLPSSSSSSGAVATCMGLTRHEVVVGTGDGCLLWLNKHTQAVAHHHCVDVPAHAGGGNDPDVGVLSLAFSPSYATFVVLTRRGHLRLFKPTSDRAAPPNNASQMDGSAPVTPFQTSSLGHFPLACAMEAPAGVAPPEPSPALASTLPLSMLSSRRPVRVGHVLLPAHPSDLQPRNFKLLSYSSTGVVQLWCYGTRQLLSTFHMRTGVTAASVSLDGHLAVVGLASGVLNILDISTPRNPRLVFSHRMHAGPVRAVEFNREGDMFATMGPRKVFFVRTNDFRVVGYTKMSDWNVHGEAEAAAQQQQQQADGAGAANGALSPTSIDSAAAAAGFAASLARQNNAEAEAAREAQALLLAEKEKHDDEDELPSTDAADPASAAPGVDAPSSAPTSAAAASARSDSLLSMCWSSAVDREKQANERLVLSTSSGLIIVLTAPNIYHDGLELKLDRAFLSPVSTRISPLGSGEHVVSLSANMSDRTILYACNSNKMVQLYNLLSTSQVELSRQLNDDIPRDPSGEPAPDADVEEIGPDRLLHQRACTIVTQALTGNLLVTSGGDGIVLLRDGETLAYITRFPVHDFLVGGTCSLSISPDSSLLVSSGFDGSLLVFDLSPLAQSLESRRTRKLKNLPQSINVKVLEQLPDTEESAGESEPSYLATHLRQGHLGVALKEKDLQAKILKDELIKSLSSFKAQFQEILQRNSRLPSLEQLALGDFAIDLELQSFLKAEGEKRVADVREQIRQECVGKEYVIERIKSQCWTAMEVKGQCFTSFRTEGLDVHNYPIRTPLAREAKRVRQIAFLRRMEVVEKRWRYSESLKVDESVPDHTFTPQKFTEDSAAYLVNHEMEREGDFGIAGLLAGGASGTSKGGEGGLGGGKDGKDADAKKKDASLGGGGAASRSKNTPIVTGPGHGKSGQSSGLGGGGPSGSGAAAEPLENLPRFLLYHPLDVITPLKKRTQAHLLASKCEAIKRAFNAQFDEFYQVKQREIEHIHEKAKRIQEIQNELQMDVPVYKPVLAPEEIAASVLTVDESEIKSAKVLSKAERVLAEAKAERERLHNESADDGPTRALEVMMGGTLETKRDLSLLEQELIPEEWMLTLAPEAMTEEQKAELAKFEKKVKLIQAEQETRRKLLQTELSKLKADVSDIAKNFDNKLRTQLVEQRIAVQRELYQHELMIIKLLNDLLTEEEKASEEREVSRKISLLHQAQEVAQALQAEYEREYRAAQSTYESMQSELKNMDRAFRKDLANGGVSAEQQHAAQLAAQEAAQEYAALVAEQQAQLAAGAGELLDEHGQPLPLPPQPSAPFLGAGESLEFLYKLFRQKKAVSKTQGGKKRAGQTKNDVDSITGRTIRAGSGLGGRLGLLGSMTASLAATAGAGAGAGATAADGSALPPTSTAGLDMRRSTSREGPSGSPVGRSKRKKGEEEESGDGTMNPYPSDLWTHLSALYSSNPQSIAPGPNPQLLEDVKYLDLSERDRPDTVEPDLWYALLERRHEYIERERGVRRFNYRMQELALHLKHLALMSSALANETRHLSQYASNLHEARALFSLNSEVVLRIQQGQVEIDESPVVSDLRECEMIDRGAVERLNAVIQAGGAEKVEILKDTTVSRTAINLLEWTRAKLQLEHEDSVDLTTELQLLRVTKSLQSLIKMGGHDNQKAAELKSLDRKIEFVSAANRDALLGKKLALMKVRRRIKQQRRENERLYETVQELEAAVKERMQISSIRDEGRLEESRASKERMKSLVTRRKLVDLAKLQSAEIQFLRDQVENLRRRTFASFAIPQLPPNPDERARTALTAGRAGAMAVAGARTTGMLPPAAGGMSPLKPAAAASGSSATGAHDPPARSHTALPAIGRDARPAPPVLPPVRGGSAGKMH